MNLKIKDKHEFIDLATYGSQARKEVRPEVYIGSERLTPLKEGDLLDANATYSLMQEAISNNLNLRWFNTNDEFLIHLHAGDIGENDICFIVDIAAIYKNGTAIGWLDKSLLTSVELKYLELNANINTLNQSLEVDKAKMRGAYEAVTATAEHINNELSKLDFETEKAELEAIEADLKAELGRVLIAYEEVDLIPTDIEPTQNSDNFLTSGTIYNAFANKINGNYTEEEYDEILRTESWENGVLYVISEDE